MKELFVSNVPQLKVKREFGISNVEQEMSTNMPFIATNESEDNKAILLVHGLNDSPFTFRDIAQDLAKHGFHVQVILLPGHGSKPQDMFLPQLNDWESLVSHYAQILQNNYSEVWLGGFSTGANLVTSYAILNEGISFSFSVSLNTSFIEEYIKLGPSAMLCAISLARDNKLFFETISFINPQCLASFTSIHLPVIKNSTAT